MLEKNRINSSLNKSNEQHNISNDYPIIKSPGSVTDNKKERQRLEKHSAPKSSPRSDNKGDKDRASPLGPAESMNKFQKFGVKVFPMGVQSGTGPRKPKDQAKSPSSLDNEINSMKEKPGKPKTLNIPSRTASPSGDSSKYGSDEGDGSRENVKAMLAKGFQNLKEKINQNTLGRKKNKEGHTEITSDPEITTKVNDDKTVSTSVKKEPVKPKTPPKEATETDCPVPKTRSTVTAGGKSAETPLQNHLQTNNMIVPEEVSRAGDVARNHRKSTVDPTSGTSRKSVTSIGSEPEHESTNKKNIKDKSKKIENVSDSENSSDVESAKTDEAKRPKRSKGKAPAPPSADLPKESGRSSVSSKHSPSISSIEINEIRRDVDMERDDKNIFEPQPTTQHISLKDRDDRCHLSAYDSDSDTEEPRNANGKDKPNHTKIELNATQVTVHQSSTGDGNDEEIEPSRKAASLGDLSKLDSEQPLSIVLERAVSLDLADGASQGNKKRKAPLPPSEEFPAVFDDLNYRKEPRLENSLGLNTFQRLKKSSDFGRLEDALYDGPKSLEVEVNRNSSPVDLTETHNTNIQEFSSWLAECRKPKGNQDERENSTSRTSSTSLVNIGLSDIINDEPERENETHYQDSSVSYSVNGQNYPDTQVSDKMSIEGLDPNFVGTNSRTVVVISQPNSLEPATVENTPSKENNQVGRAYSTMSEDDTTLEPFITANESRLESFKNTCISDEESPPRLPTSPIPIMSSSSTLSSPLSSSLTYITEIKVSTSLGGGNSRSSSLPNANIVSTSPLRSSLPSELTPRDLITSTPISSSKSYDGIKSISDKIQQFDNKYMSKPLISPTKPKLNSFSDYKNNGNSALEENHSSFESTSRIPIKTMKSETGQRVLEKIQSLAAKETSPPKATEEEYAKRVASLFSGNSLERNNVNVRKQTEILENELNRPNVSGFYLKDTGNSPPKFKDSFTNKKVPPVVPPRKMETALTTKSTLTVDLSGKNPGFGHTVISEKVIPSESPERNIVTFSSFMPKSQNEDSGNSSMISFKIKDHGEINGGHVRSQEDIVPVKTSATKLIFESKDNNSNY